MSGRFIGIEKIRKKRLRSPDGSIPSIGFAFSHDSRKDSLDDIPVDYEDDDFNEFDDSESELYTHQDIIDFGFLDEFVGRVFDVVEFKKLSREDLVDVILAKGSPLTHFVESVKVKGQEIFIDQANFERMAEAAYGSPRGARCLDSIVSHFLIPADRDFMMNYRPVVMEYDQDGNYTSIFEGKDGKYRFNHIDGPRLKRRKDLLKKKEELEKDSSDATDKKSMQLSSDTNS
jgi:ATP-dependent protease Clp ATPase subunit